MNDESIEEIQPAAETLSEEIEALYDQADEPVHADEEESTESTTEEVEEIKEAVEALEAPSNWAAEDREVFGKLASLGAEGVEAQKFLQERHKSMERDYTQKRQADAESLRQSDPIHQAIAPYVESMQLQGVAPAQKVSQLLQIERSLQENPQATLQWLANQYQIDVTDVAPEEQNPEIANLKGELRALQESIAQRERLTQEERLTSVQTQIEQFRGEKTDAGEPAHPYFDDLMEDIIVLAAAEREAGREINLNNLYEKAGWMNPSVRQKIIASQQKAEAEKAGIDARQRSEKARAAGSSVRGTPGGASPTSDLSLHEEIAQQFG